MLHSTTRGVARVERVEADPEPVHDAGTEALDDDVGTVDEPEKRLVPQGVLEVDGQRALVAVHGMEHRRVLVDERRHPAHVVATGGVLDLDDVGAEVRQEHRAERSRQQSGEVEDSHVVECRHGRASVAIVRLAHLAAIPVLDSSEG